MGREGDVPNDEHFESGLRFKEEAGSHASADRSLTLRAVCLVRAIFKVCWLWTWNLSSPFSLLFVPSLVNVLGKSGTASRSYISTQHVPSVFFNFATSRPAIAPHITNYQICQAVEKEERDWAR